MPKRIIVLISQAFTSMTADSYKITCVDICRSVVSVLLTDTPTAHNTSQSPVFLTYIANSHESSFSRLIVHIQTAGNTLCTAIYYLKSFPKRDRKFSTRPRFRHLADTQHSTVPHSDSQQILRRSSLQHSQKYLITLPYIPLQSPHTCHHKSNLTDYSFLSHTVKSPQHNKAHHTTHNVLKILRPQHQCRTLALHPQIRATIVLHAQPMARMRQRSPRRRCRCLG